MLPPRYGLPFVGFMGREPYPPASQGCCHGAVPSFSFSDQLFGHSRIVIF